MWFSPFLFSQKEMSSPQTFVDFSFGYVGYPGQHRAKVAELSKFGRPVSNYFFGCFSLFFTSWSVLFSNLVWCEMHHILLQCWLQYLVLYLPYALPSDCLDLSFNELYFSNWRMLMQFEISIQPLWVDGAQASWNLFSLIPFLWFSGWQQPNNDTPSRGLSIWPLARVLSIRKMIYEMVQEKSDHPHVCVPNIFRSSACYMQCLGSSPMFLVRLRSALLN